MTPGEPGWLGGLSSSWGCLLAAWGAWSGSAIWHCAVPGMSLVPGECGEQLLWEPFPPPWQLGLPRACVRSQELLSQRKAKSHPWSSPTLRVPFTCRGQRPPPSSDHLSALVEFPGLAGKSVGPAVFLSGCMGTDAALCLCSSSLQVSTAAVGTCSVPFTGTLTCTPAPTTTRQKLLRRFVRRTPSLLLRRSRSCEGG